MIALSSPLSINASSSGRPIGKISWYFIPLNCRTTRHDDPIANCQLGKNPDFTQNPTLQLKA